MSVAVLSAVPVELQLLRDGLRLPVQQNVASWSAWRGEIEGRDVVLAEAGLGKVNTAALAALLWERHRPSLFVFTGVAGALDPSLGVGDLVVGEKTVHHDAGVLGPEGLQPYQAGHIPFFNPTRELGYRPSPGLIDLARDVAAGTDLTPVIGRHPRIHIGVVLTGDQFVDDTVTRDRLHRELGGHVVEMEGAALAQTAARLGVDHLVIRSVSDSAGDGAADEFKRFLSEASENSARLVRALIGRL